MKEDDLSQKFGELLDKHTEKAFQGLKKDSEAALRDQRNLREGFETRLSERWQEAFDAFEVTLTFARETCGNFNSSFRKEEKVEDVLVFDTLTRLHARACLIASEIYALLRGGFASGAFSRWRSLHETSVVAFFISEHGPKVAKRYRDHEVVQSYWAAKEYDHHHETLGYDPLEDGTIESLKEECDQLEAEYGSAFFCSDYAWAHEAVNENRSDESRADLKLLEHEVGLEHLRPFYRMASHSIHANPKSIAHDIGLIDQDEILLAGPSNTGFADPGICASISLHQATVALLSYSATPEALLNLKVLEQLVEETEVAFHDAQKQIEAEERNRRQDNEA